MNSDGTGEIQLTNEEQFAVMPIFSPDGSRIAMAIDWDINIMNTDGTEQINITNSDYDESTPIFTRDGKKIIFEASLGSGYTGIYSIDLNNLNEINQIVQNTFEYISDLCISPDSSKITWSAGPGGWGDIWVVNSDGSNLQNITLDLSGTASNPCFSPDSTKIIFRIFNINDNTDPNDATSGLDIIDLNTLKLTQILDNGADYRSPIWITVP